MTKELVTKSTYEQLTQNFTDSSSIILQKLEETLPLVEKQISELCLPKNKDTTIADLQYSGQTPLVWLQQCAMQQQSRLHALKETYFRHKKNELRIKKLYEKNTEMSILKAQEIEAGLETSATAIRNALEEVQNYQDQIDALRKNFNIPEVPSPEMIRQNDKREKIRGAFRRALEEMEAHNTIPRGVQESLEWSGVHPLVAKMHCAEYINAVKELMEQGKAPTMMHMHQWLDEMEKLYINCPDSIVQHHLKNTELNT